MPHGMEKNDEQFHIYIFSYTCHDHRLLTHANTYGHKKEYEFIVYVSHSNMGNVRYTKSDYKGARSVGGTPRFCGSPGRSHRGTTQHRVSLQGGGIRPDHERPAMLPRSRGGDGRGRNGNRQREREGTGDADRPTWAG